jgi:hypothetical protein
MFVNGKDSVGHSSHLNGHVQSGHRRNEKHCTSLQWAKGIGKTIVY